MNLEEILLLVQVVVLPTTLLVIACQAYLSAHLSRSSLRQDASLRCESDYTSIVRLLIEKPELQKIYTDLYGDEWTSYSEDERLVYNYLQLMYDLFDRVFWLYEHGWTDRDTWQQWENWLRELARHPLFVDFHNDTRGNFPRSYQERVDKIIAEVQTK